MPYNSETAEAGKQAARDALRRRLGLSGWDGDSRPVVAVVSRLTEQKGVHLIEHAAWRALDRGAQFVLLGSAPDPKVQGRFDALASRLQSDNAAFVFAFDEPLSHLIYAGADLIVMPSMFEPCGLAQLISVRDMFFSSFFFFSFFGGGGGEKTHFSFFEKKNSALTAPSPSSAPRVGSTTRSSTSTTTRPARPGRSRGPLTGSATGSTPRTVSPLKEPTRERSTRLSTGLSTPSTTIGNGSGLSSLGLC